MQLAAAESLERVEDPNDANETNPAPAPAGGGSKFVVQSVALLVCLGAYTFGPLFVNWSVVVDVSPEAEATVLSLPARDGAKKWYDVTLSYQPGINKLFVEKKDKRRQCRRCRSFRRGYPLTR